jgi:hypothetical protein
MYDVTVDDIPDFARTTYFSSVFGSFAAPRLDSHLNAWVLKAPGPWVDFQPRQSINCQCLRIQQ